MNDKEITHSSDVKGDGSSQGFTLLDLVLIFIKRKKFILYFTLIFLVLSIVFYFFVFDLIYYSSATIKSSNKASGLLGSLSGISDIGGIDALGLSGGKSAKELSGYEEILTSRRCLEALITKFNLMQRDDYVYLEDAIKDFRENRLSLSQEKLSGVLYIGVYDKDPKLAKEMVEFLLVELDKINIELNITEAKNNREFIEQRYLIAKQDLVKAEDSLKAFQLIYGVAPDLQVKAAAQTLFTMEAELKTEEVKLDVLKQMLSADEPEVKTQTSKITSIKSKINEISRSTDLNDLLRMGNSPQIVMTYLRLQREIEIQSRIQTFLLPLYEQAKIEEKRDTPTVLILDKPYIAERKSKPKRLTMTVVITFFAFGFSFLIAVFFEKLKNFKALTSKKDN